jgi:hypothetical protein
MSMRRVLDTIFPKETHLRLLRSEFNWLLNDFIGLRNAEMKVNFCYLCEILKYLYETFWTMKNLVANM